MRAGEEVDGFPAQLMKGHDGSWNAWHPEWNERSILFGGKFKTIELYLQHTLLFACASLKSLFIVPGTDSLTMAAEGSSTSSVSKGCFLFNPTTTQSSRKKKKTPVLSGEKRDSSCSSVCTFV